VSVDHHLHHQHRGGNQQYPGNRVQGRVDVLDDIVDPAAQVAGDDAEEDRRRKELIEARNNADNQAYSAEKVLRDLGDKVPADLKSQVEEKIAKLREVMNSNDLETIQRASEDLNQVLQRVGAAAYQQSGPAAGAPGADKGPSSGEGEDVVDGEFRNA
jgi:molecular chaperone DnaK